MTHYTREEVREIGNNELSPELLGRASNALNGFADLFGKEWVEKKVVVSKINMDGHGEFIQYCGKFGLVSIISLWENWSLIKGLNGADKLRDKLKIDERNQNVDFEISIAANLCRHGATVDIEPSLDSGRKTDCRFKLNNSDWVYVEASRRISSPEFNDAKKALAREAGNAAKRIYPGTLGTIILFNWDEYDQVMDWLKSLDSINAENLEKLSDLAVFFVSPPGGYDPTRAFAIMNHKPHFYGVSDGSAIENTFGTMYCHLPDFNGCKNKIHEKKEQLPQDVAGIIVVDVTSVAGAFKDWIKVIQEELFSSSEYVNVSAIVLIRSEMTSHAGSRLRRETVTVCNKNANNPLSIAEQELYGLF